MKAIRHQPARRRSLGACAGLCVIAALALAGAPAGHAQEVGDRLDLDGMSLSFEDEFDTLEVSPWGPGTRWIAHTPWSGDFGGARFADPGKETPFSVENGILAIKASRGTDGKWQSGLLASVDTKGNGFSQRYGYFEMRARLPSGRGLWPAFWLIGKDRSRYTAEIDILEYYGDKPNGYSSTVHVWHRDGRHYSRHSRIDVFPAADPGEFHTYGVKIDPDWIRFYFDRDMVWKTQTQPEHRQPLYMLVNLALVDGPTKELAPDPSIMQVDYVRAWRLD